jgi:hypothetical protein
MLHSRRNRGTKELLQDATRAGSRVAEQAQQTLSDIAGDSRGFAQTARTELGGLSREMRDQAGGKVSRARRRTARKLAKAADAVEPSGDGRGRRRKPLLKAVLATAAGWALVNVARKARQKPEGPGPTDTDAAAGDGAGDAAATEKATAASKPEPAKAGAGKATAPAASSATKANASSK